MYGRLGKAVLASVGLGVLVVPTAGARPVDTAATAAAVKARVEVNSISSPPRGVRAPGSTFTVTGRVANASRSTRQARVRITLRRTKGSLGRVVGSRTMRVRAGRTLRYRVTVRIPSTLVNGNYYVRACADYGRSTPLENPTGACRYAKRRVVVRRAAPAAPVTPPAAQPAPPVTQPGRPADTPPGVDILVFTKAPADAQRAQLTSAGVEAVRGAAEAKRFRVTVTDDAAAFTEAKLKNYRAVVFLNTLGDVLDDAQQRAFEAYYKDGGGFLGVGSAIETETSWPYLSELLATRATGQGTLATATVKVADRVHDASKTLPERWQLRDAYYNFERNVRGSVHVLATVDETTYGAGTMGVDHPVMWCQDRDGGRSFYTNTGSTTEAFDNAEVVEHLAGALAWTAGEADPEYSDCGATVLSNYQQTKISVPPNINEPIGFDQLPDGRIIQTIRDGRVRLHDPASGTSEIIADWRSGPDLTPLPGIPGGGTYTHSEDGMYGPAVDPEFATNRWVYLFYAPINMDPPFPANSPRGPDTAAPTTSPDPAAWDAYKGYFQLSRFKFIDRQGATPPRLDPASEQKIMKVAMDRGACCHVGGDIDFDGRGNLWLVTGDDTPAGGGNSGGFSPHNDQKTDQEIQTLQLTATPAGTAAAPATGGTFTLTFAGQTTAPIAYNATAAQVLAALEALSNINTGDITVTGNALNTTNANGVPNTQTITFVRTGQYVSTNVAQITADASGLQPPGARAITNTTQHGDAFQAPFVDARRSSLNTNDLRGKVLRIRVMNNPTGEGLNQSYTVPAGNLFAVGQAQTRPEIYAMGFRNPFRIQVDSNGIAYVTDYSPDSNTPQDFRGPAGTGRIEIVRAPANYGWPLCYKKDLPYYRWNFNTSTNAGPPYECAGAWQGPPNESRWNTGRTVTPPITDPDVWYSFRDNASPPLGTPCLAYYNGSGVSCPQLFPELGTGGVGPHGAAKYEYNPRNPAQTKFPPYFDGAVFFGEFTRNYLKEFRLDSAGRILKINDVLNCGEVGSTAPFECDNPMDMQFGADGSFYLLTYGDGFFVANPDAGMYRWDYVAGPQAPNAVMSATPTNGAAPLTVQFSSDGSRDPDPQDSIRFEWDFDTRTPSVDSTDPNPVHTYTERGVYTASLTVTDAGGRTSSRTLQITVGNTAPTIIINTPADGDFFDWGQGIPYTITVTDPEDGTIDCSRVQTTFVLIHDTHGHGEDTRPGCSGTLTTLAEYASHGGYIAGGISVSYTDRGSGGIPALTTTTQHVIQQRRQQPEFAQDVRGIQFGAVAVTESDPGGGQDARSLDPGDYIGLNNRYNFRNMEQRIVFRFAQNGAAGTTRGNVEVRLDSPTGPVVATCTLVATGGPFTNQNCPFTTTVPAGPRRIYLVFQRATGGPATGFGNLNYVQFFGPGIG